MKYIPILLCCITSLVLATSEDITSLQLTRNPFVPMHAKKQPENKKLRKTARMLVTARCEATNRCITFMEQQNSIVMRDTDMRSTQAPSSRAKKGTAHLVSKREKR